MTREGRAARSASEALRAITSDGFGDSVLCAPGPVAVAFLSCRCVHSRAIEPVLHRVAQTVKPRVTICRIDVSVEPELADHYWIAGTPTFVMFLGALEVGRVEGPPPTFSAVLAAVTRPFTPTGARYENAG